MSSLLPSFCSKRPGFSLVELLVVVALVMFLLALLVPVVGEGREQARLAGCAANLRTLGTASFLLAADNDGALPASISWGNYQGYEKTAAGESGVRQRGFIGSELLPEDMHPSDARRLRAERHTGYETEGMLYRYAGVKDIRKVVRCPGLELAPAPRIGRGVGSNGLHDYSMISGFTGARATGLPGSCLVNAPGGAEAVPVPLFIEEDPAYGCNAQYVDMDFTTINRMGTWHREGTGQYFTTLGGVFTLRFGQRPGPRCLDWYDVPTPRGNLFRLGDITPVNYRRLSGATVRYGNQTYGPIDGKKTLYGAWQQL